MPRSNRYFAFILVTMITTTFMVSGCDQLLPRQVPDRFQEVTDPFDGASKMLGYALLSQDGDAKLVFSCENKSIHTYFSFRSLSGPWGFDIPIDLRTKVDAEAAAVLRFSAVSGTTAIAPGQATQTDNIAFLQALRNHDHLVIKASVAGLGDTVDRPSIFDIRDIEIPIDRVLAACSADISPVKPSAVAAQPVPPSSDVSAPVLPPVEGPKSMLRPLPSPQSEPSDAVGKPADAFQSPSTTAPPDAPPNIIVNPSWRRRPGPDDMRKFYPATARREDVSGKAVVECVVLATGWLTQCVVASEEPSGYGFGAAAIAFATETRMNPRTLNGTPVDGARVRLPLSFVADGH